jgi:uncharacterized protein (DUF1697 family)
MRYVALLRAVNVGGNSLVRMPDLQTLFEALGLTDVATYIQSGNVVFSAKPADQAKLAQRIERHLHAGLGFRPTVFIRTRADLTAAAKGNPFQPERRDGEQQCHIMFLSGAPDAAAVSLLEAKGGDQYRFALKGDVLYYAYSRDLAGKRKTVPIEKLLGVTGTARTWKVVNKLIEMLEER